ncbi:MAG: phosphoenolpyruvate--protein phosphotransferase [Spirochaetales bacterium]|nr:phosphoenolpyruvate--protein phosphotransferase [Spirochaetales bacterium]MCF7939310.1 phosphoenolpyruvate--protein phosphotransferase [Spirochaetales bacterium]
MKEFTGISASPGIAIGRAFPYLEDSTTIPHYDITDNQIAMEYQRFVEAADKAAVEIQDIIDNTSEEDRYTENNFLETHVMMLNDPEFRQKVNEGLKQQQVNVERVLMDVVDDLVGKMSNAQDSYLQERTVDLHDVSRRVLNHLLYRERLSLADLQEEIILVTHNLLPTDAVLMNKRMVKGIAMDVGGKTSHTAILSRAFEIPAVLGLSSITQEVRTGDTLIIDGNKGVVIVEPDDKTLDQYVSNRKEWERREVQLLYMNELAAETTDGKLIKLTANIEVPEEIDSVLSHGADGIGLFRSEFLFIQPNRIADEEEQYQAYSKVLQAMPESPVTIRTLDVGGDKVIPELKGMDEQNPILGWRAVRFCLSNLDIFRTQLRALLRASPEGDLRIMFPMISGVEELVNVMNVLNEVKEDLRRENIPFNEDIPVGIMIEVPSAALTSDILAKEASFFSIGTNDLIQYTIAVDRGNEKIAYLYEPFHPGVLRLLQIVIHQAHEQGIEVSMCGELAGDPYAAVILLGLGLDEYSMSSFSIPEVKKIIRSVSMSTAEELVGEILEMKSYHEIDRYIRSWMDERFEILSR